MELQPEKMGRRLHVSPKNLGRSGIGRVDEQGHDRCRGEQFAQEF
jgi:hypothetical protein